MAVSGFSVLVFAIIALLFTALETNVRQQVQTEIDYQANWIFHMLAQDIRNADSITNPISGTSTILVLNRNSQTITYSLLSDTMNRTVDSTTTALTTDLTSVSNLVFTNLTATGSSDQAIGISFDIQGSSTSNRSEYQVTESYSSTYVQR